MLCSARRNPHTKHTKKITAGSQRYVMHIAAADRAAAKKTNKTNQPLGRTSGSRSMLTSCQYTGVSGGEGIMGIRPSATAADAKTNRQIAMSQAVLQAVLGAFAIFLTKGASILGKPLFYPRVKSFT